MNNKLISIVIVTYNSCTVIGECLESISLYNDIGNKLEIIIVDNSPISNIIKVVDELELDLDIEHIHNPKNGGFGQGNNIGADAAAGEILFILNPDTILIEPIFSFMGDEMSKTNLSVAGFTLVDRDGNINDTIGLLPEYNFVLLPKKIINYFVIEKELLSKYIFPWGADIVIRKKDFVNAGMFDENIFLCNEEPDLMQRLNIQKVKIFKKKIIHLEGHTTDVHEVRFKEQLKSTRYYFKKYNKNYGLYISVFLLRTTLRRVINLSLFTDFSENSKIYKILMNEYKLFKDMK